MIGANGPSGGGRTRPRRMPGTAAGFAVVLLAAASPALATAEYGYDRLGRLTTALYPNGTCILYVYDANGNRTQQIVAPSTTPPRALWGTPNWNAFLWSSAPQEPVWGSGGMWGCFQWAP